MMCFSSLVAVVFLLLPMTTCSMYEAGPPSLDALSSLPQSVRSCFLNNVNRSSCGLPGSTTQQCEDSGCCWDSSVSGRPWCFFPQLAPDDAFIPGPTIRYTGSQTPPTVASTLGALHASVSGDVAGVSCLALPPLAQECDYNGSGPALAYGWPFNSSVAGLPPVLGLSFTWMPYQLVRSAATAAGDVVTTQVRLSGSSSLLLLLVTIDASASPPAAAPHFSAAVPMLVSAFGGVWTWRRPTASSNPAQYSVSLSPSSEAAGGFVAASADTTSDALAASAVWGGPLKCSTSWHVGTIGAPGLPSGPAAFVDIACPPLPAPCTFGLVLSLGSASGGGGAAAVSAAAVSAAANFESTWDAARADWDGLWSDAFNASGGGGRFSGSLPILPWGVGGTGAYNLSRAYYGGVVSMLQLLRNVSGPNATDQGWQLPTAGPVWAVTTTYLWDSSMVGSLMAMLEPTGWKAVLGELLSIGLHEHYAADYLSGTGVGPWYSFNDVSMFTLLDKYGTAQGVRENFDRRRWSSGSNEELCTPPSASSISSSGAAPLHRHPLGDLAWYNSSLLGRRVIEWMDASATAYQALPQIGALTDYGLASNLLECVPSYLHAVPSLNAANVLMLNRTSAIWAALGNTSRAAALSALAGALLPHVLETYVSGSGYWACTYPDNSVVPVRHVVDFIYIADAVAWALDEATRSEMATFLYGELKTVANTNSGETNGTWMRALSLLDPAANASDRADHGPLGSYDGWVPRSAIALAELGDAVGGAAFLSAAAGVLDETCFGQSHRLLLHSNVPIKAGGDGGQDALESVGGAFAEAALVLIAQMPPCAAA